MTLMRGVIAATLAMAAWTAHASGSDAEARTLSVSGPIVAVDVDVARLTVEDSRHGSLVVDVPRSARLRLDGEGGAVVEDLFPGDEILSAEVRRSNSGRLYLVEAEITSLTEQERERLGD